MLWLICIDQLLHDFVWNINKKFSVRYIYILFYLGKTSYFLVEVSEMLDLIISMKYGPNLLGTESLKPATF